MSAKYEGLNLYFRISATIICFLLGFMFPLLFLLSGMIAWSIYSDIKEAPERALQREEAEKRANAPVSPADIRDYCESPAEEAFLDAMVQAFNLETGPGAIEGGGLRLRNQVGMGQFRIHHRGDTSWQYRADFLVDERLVVEIDGETYHSSPEAVARDQKRDVDLRREGYSILRIPARLVFEAPEEAVNRVRNARH